MIHDSDSSDFANVCDAGEVSRGRRLAHPSVPSSIGMESDFARNDTSTAMARLSNGLTMTASVLSAAERRERRRGAFSLSFPHKKKKRRFATVRIGCRTLLR